MVPASEENQRVGRNSTTLLSDHNLNTDPLWTADDVAAYLRLEAETVRSMTRKGRLPGFKVGRVWRYRYSEIKGWLQTKSK